MTNVTQEVFELEVLHLKELIELLETSVERRVVGIIESTKFALEAADKAILKSEVATDKRFSSVNEFRATLTDQQRTFIPRVEADLQNKSILEGLHDQIKKMEALQLALTKYLTVSAYELRHSELQSQVNDVKISLTNLTGSKAGVTQGWGYAIGAIGLIVAVLAILARFL